MTTPGATLEVFGTKTAGQPIGTIVICTRDHLNAATATAMWTSDLSFLGKDESLQRYIIQGSILTLQRNEALKRMEGDWILFIDDDMVWQPQDIGRLIRSYEELSVVSLDPVIVGALCHRRAAPYDPTLYMRQSPTSGGYRFLETWDTDIVEVDATGLAFVIIPKDALEQVTGIEWPDTERRLQLPPPPVFRWNGTLGEDLQFCQEAKAAGVKIFVDTRIEIGHVSEIVVSHTNFLEELARRPWAVAEAVKLENDKMGLPTLMPTDALDKLQFRR